jgi:hypothetical protein
MAFFVPSFTHPFFAHLVGVVNRMLAKPRCFRGLEEASGALGGGGEEVQGVKGARKAKDPQKANIPKNYPRLLRL